MDWADDLAKRIFEDPEVGVKQMNVARVSELIMLAVYGMARDQRKTLDSLAWMIEDSEELLAMNSWKEGSTARNIREMDEHRSRISTARAVLEMRLILEPEKVVNDAALERAR